MSATIEGQRQTQDEDQELREPYHIQDGMFDTVIDDPDLADALDRRWAAKDKRSAAQKTFNERHDVVKGKLDALDLEEGAVVRCGRHRVEVKATAPRSVSFDTAPGRRLQIKLIED